MRIKFLFITNTVLVFAANVQWPMNHRFHSANEKISSHGKSVPTSTMKRDNGVTSMSRDASMGDALVKEEKEHGPWNLSKESDRVHFQIEGHEGPETYIFGFDTGHGKSRQYRLEERQQDGTVKGQYGYYDAKGKLRTVRYVAKPFEGYTEIHHETNARKVEN